jgi:hypothetical protein
LYNDIRSYSDIRAVEGAAGRHAVDPQILFALWLYATIDGVTSARRLERLAEFPNADCRNRGLTQFRVRGLTKVKAQAMWHVLAFNLLRFIKLGCPSGATTNTTQNCREGRTQ